MPEDDYRRHFSRFQGENFTKNVEVVSLIENMASQKGCTPAQLSLAWLLARGEQIVPIPGTKRLERVQENFGALQVKLTTDDIWQRLNAYLLRVWPQAADLAPSDKTLLIVDSAFSRTGDPLYGLTMIHKEALICCY